MLRVQDVLFLPGLGYNVLSISMMERKGFKGLFQDGKAIIINRGSKSDGIVLGVRENDLYRLKGKPEDHIKKQGQVQVLEE